MNGFVLYRGPSALDGKPIVCIATGLETGGSNKKTGSMVQIYILCDGINPLKAVQTGADVSICGNCPLRGRVIEDPKEPGKLKNIERLCYVTLFHGPRVTYDAFERGIYPAVPLSKARKLLAHRKVRVGAYGDPAAVPFQVWEQALDKVAELNSYTHSWRRFPQLSAFCMASVESEAEREEARALGFRTYRVRMSGAPKMTGEGHCPASKEMGKAVQCALCMLCGGKKTDAKADITIEAHGAGAKWISKIAEPA
jgi:hypothetical protein